MDREAFIQKMTPFALEESRRTGVDPRIIIAQAAVESGYGRSAPGNNYFGIKSHGQPGGQTLATTEVGPSGAYRTQDSFRTYAGMADSARGYGDFILQNPRYQAMRSASGLDAQLAALGKSGYATDPNYAQKVGAVARGVNLYSPPVDPYMQARAGGAPQMSIGQGNGAPAFYNNPNNPPLPPPQPVDTMVARASSSPVADAAKPLPTIGNFLRGIGNKVAPDMVDAPKAATPEEQAAFAKAQKDDDYGMKDFAALAQMGAPRQPQRPQMMAPQINRGQFVPIQPFTGLLG